MQKDAPQTAARTRDTEGERKRERENVQNTDGDRREMTDMPNNVENGDMTNKGKNQRQSTLENVEML